MRGPNTAVADPTVAERSGNGFRLNGAKGFVLDGHVADDAGGRGA